MERSQTAEMLAYAHSTLGGEVTQLEVESWHDAVGALDAADAAEACRWLCARAERMIRPGDLLRRVRTMRNDRSERAAIGQLRVEAHKPVGKPSWFDAATQAAAAARRDGRDPLAAAEHAAEGVA